MYRVGLIGLEGHQGVILEGILRHGGSTLAAVAGGSEATVKMLKSHRAVTPETRFYEDYKEMLAEEKLDIVGICNPNSEHAEAIISCAEAGVHIISEKPLTTTLEDLERVREAVLRSGVKMTMMLTMRFEPAYKLMRGLVMGGEIGEPILAFGQKSYRLGVRPEWMKRRKTFGGIIPFIGIHLLDLIRWITGREFAEGIAYHSNIAHPEVGEMEDNAGMLLKLDNGGTAVITLDYLRPMSAPTHGDDRLRIAGGRGVIEATDNGSKVVLITPERGVRELELPEGESLYLDFIESIEEDRPPKVTPEDAFRITEVALKLRDSADKGEKVSLAA